MEIIVDTREKCAWKFTAQQATASKEALPMGDYGVKLCGEWIAVVERMTDFASSLTSGKLEYGLADLEQVPRAVVLVDDRYSSVFQLEHVRPSVVADTLAECPGSPPKGAHPVRRNSDLGPGVGPPILRRGHLGAPGG